MGLTRKQARHEFVSTRDAAKTAFEQAKGDVTKACALLRKWINRESNLYEMLVEPLIDRAIENQINHLVRERRRCFNNAAQSNERNNTSGLLSMASSNVRDWFDYPLAGGKKLGDATKADLLRETNYYDKSAKTQAHIARWLKRLSKKLSATDNVRDIFNSDSIEKLFETSRQV